MNKYEKAEEFLKGHTIEQMRETVEMFGGKTTRRRETLTQVPKTKPQLIDDLIEKYESINGQLSEWGKEEYSKKTLTTLKIEAKKEGVNLYCKTYRMRDVEMSRPELVELLIFETNFADSFE